MNTNTNIVQQRLSTYQLLGLKKLIEYKSIFIYKNGYQISLKAAVQMNNFSVHDDKIEEFTNIFCEYQLADTDYRSVQNNAIMHELPISYIDILTLPDLLKLLTYIIWTDKILQGYFFARIHDKSLFVILERIEKLIKFTN